MAVIRDIQFTPDGRRIVSASDDKTVRIWNLSTGKTERIIRGEIGDGDNGKALSLAISPDGSRLAVGGMLSGNRCRRLDHQALRFCQRRSAGDPAGTYRRSADAGVFAGWHDTGVRQHGRHGDPVVDGRFPGQASAQGAWRRRQRGPLRSRRQPAVDGIGRRNGEALEVALGQTDRYRRRPPGGGVRCRRQRRQCARLFRRPRSYHPLVRCRIGR